MSKGKGWVVWGRRKRANINLLLPSLILRRALRTMGVGAHKLSRNIGDALQDQFRGAPHRHALAGRLLCGGAVQGTHAHTFLVVGEKK